MERALNPPSAVKPRQGQGIILLPGTQDAEPWDLWFTEGNACRFSRVCASPRENPWPRKSTLVLPVAQVFCLPLWLNETETSRLPAMIELQLEARGLSTRHGTPAIYQWEIAARDNNRVLVLVAVLPNVLPTELQARAYNSFDVSARYFPWPENAVTLWQEQGKLAVVITRGKSVVYFQSLGEEHCSTRVVQTLVCLLASLQLQRVIEKPASLVTCAELAAPETALLQKALNLRVTRLEQPAPVPPAHPWNLCPPEVAQSKKESQVQRWRGRAALVALAVYLIVAGAFILNYVIGAVRLSGLQKWQQENGPALATIESAQSDWRRLAPVVDTANYPLEVLLNCAKAMPKDQLHLTLFEMDDDGTVQLKGEATNIQAAYQFFDRLKAESDLHAYTWKMDEPHLLPNDLAQLQIEGTHAAINP